MKYYLIAGEASGDLHGSNLMREIKHLDVHAKFRCWGGDLMQQQGGELVMHYKHLAFMGFAEVLMNIRTILKNINFCKKDILSAKPDVLILIDYPGFNLRIAEFAKRNGIKVFYYISPQIWAWKQSRVKKIKQCVDRMFVILPFEADFYRRFNYSVDFVGHPLLDAIEQKKSHSGSDDFMAINQLSNKPVIAILPGSRKQEVEAMLPIMLSVIDQFPEYQFVIAGVPSISGEFYNPFLKDKDVKIVFDSTYSLLQHAFAALVTSGTATLETALFGVPEVVCYKGGTISYHIAKRLVKVKYISLVNLILDEMIVPEMIQNDLNASNLKKELAQITQNLSYRNQMLDKLNVLKERLGGIGASKKAAELMLGYLKTPNTI